MSSHQDWADEICAKHKAEKPFAPENGQPLQFTVGDAVIYTNSYGVEFQQCVTGFYQPGEGNTLYARGYRYLLDTDCYWMPVTETSLRKDDQR